MRLPVNGREYVTWPITGAPEGASFEVRFTSGTTVGEWMAMESVDTGARVLVAGPDADPGDAVVLPEGRTHVQIRLTDNPEVVVRDASVIDVK